MAMMLAVRLTEAKQGYATLEAFADGPAFPTTSPRSRSLGG
jgi:hypothetical protein